MKIPFKTISLEDFIKQYIPDWNEADSFERFKIELLEHVKSGEISQEKYDYIIRKNEERFRKEGY